MSLCEKIQLLCNKRGITIYRLEKDCNLGNGSVMKWEKSSPKVENVIKVANYFGVSTDYLLDLAENSSSANFAEINKIEQAVNKPLACTPHVVAHIDILGTKAKVANKNLNQELLETMTVFVDECKFYIKTFNKLNYVAEMLSFKVFSDNIVIYIPFDKEKYNDYVKVICLAAGFFQRTLLLNKKLPLLVRGGICIENFYADNDFVYGQALIDSYTIEENLAIVPRIVISEAIVETLFNKNELSQFVGYNNLLIDDFDGFYYVNFLYDQGKDEVLQIQEFISKTISELKLLHSQQVTNKLHGKGNSVSDYSRLYQKYGWLSNYCVRYYQWLVGRQMNLSVNVGLTEKGATNIRLASDFENNYADLLSDTAFTDTAKLYQTITPEQRKVIVGIIAAYFIDTLHKDTFPIIGR